MNLDSTSTAVTVAVVVVLVVVIVLAILDTSGIWRTFSRRRRAVPTAHTEEGNRPLPAVVANPTKTDDDDRKAISEVARELGWAEPLWIETTVEDPGVGQAKEALAQGADLVMACGGDGTVRMVAEAMAGSGIPMGLLPAGTGNLLARTVGTPLEMRPAVRVALDGRDRPIDIGRIRVDDEPDEHLFLVMAGTGFDAAVMENTPEDLKAKVGPLAYVMSGLRAMKGKRARVTITLDGGEPLRRSSRTVLVGNSGTLLGGLVLMPQAAVDDGIFDVVNLAPKGLAGWIAVAARVITRTRRGHSRVEHWEAKEVVIEIDQPQASQVDGDPVGDASKLTVRVDPGALIVRVPEDPPAGTPDPGSV